jgi:hypothetical protein
MHKQPGQFLLVKNYLELRIRRMCNITFNLVNTTNDNLSARSRVGVGLRPITKASSWKAALAALLALGGCLGAVRAASIPVPNGSFESPTPPPGFPATPLVDVWQKSPQPAWFDPATTGGITWQQLAGVFPNAAAGSPEHIDNLDGDQAAYMFTLPSVALFQELDTAFQAGLSYDLKVGVLGAGGIAEGSSFAVSLYYRDGANQPVTLAATPITYTASLFPLGKHMIDFELSLSAAQPGDAWVGRNIGIQLLSTFGTGAGYWDLDNVRLTAVPEPAAAGLLTLGLGGLLFGRASGRGERTGAARRDV